VAESIRKDRVDRTTVAVNRPDDRRRGRYALLLAVGLSLVVAAALTLVFMDFYDASPVSTTDPTDSVASATPTPSPTGSPSVKATGTPTRPPGTTSPKAYPSSATTGWRRTKVTLAAQGGNRTITKSGTVISGKDVAGCLQIAAANVRIVKSRIRCDGYYPVEVIGQGSLTIEDTEIDGLGSSKGNCIAGENFIAVRIDCHDVGDGMRMGSNSRIENSYIHDLATCGNCHNDGIQVTGAVGVVIRHNTIENEHSQTSAILLGNEFGPLRDVLVENNLLSGGGFTLYGGGSDSNVSQIRVINNRFRRTPDGFFPKGGSYGPVAYFDTRLSGNSWSGNVWHDSGEAIAAVRG
jgi:hypothetical protein